MNYVHAAVYVMCVFIFPHLWLCVSRHTSINIPPDTARC